MFSRPSRQFSRIRRTFFRFNDFQRENFPAFPFVSGFLVHFPALPFSSLLSNPFSNHPDRFHDTVVLFPDFPFGFPQTFPIFRPSLDFHEFSANFTASPSVCRLAECFPGLTVSFPGLPVSFPGPAARFPDFSIFNARICRNFRSFPGYPSHFPTYLTVFSTASLYFPDFPISFPRHSPTFHRFFRTI